MKKILFGILIITLTLFVATKNVYAAGHVYYTNPNGVDMTKEQYEFITTLFADAYVDLITQAEFDEYLEDGLFDGSIEIKTYTPSTLPLHYQGEQIRSDTHSTPDKTLQIGKSCTTKYCMISLINTWHVVPSVTSWDDIGIYVSGTTVKSHSYTLVTSSVGSTYYNNLIQSSNAMGNSVDLPENATNIIVNMAAKVNKNGTVFGSYQHAMIPTTLLVSQDYNFDILGYGNVFLYYGNAVGVYDGMNGVDISV